MQWHKGEALRLSFLSSFIFLCGRVMENKKVPLILFSGGLDSTFLLEQELLKGDVEILYVRGVLHPTKMEEELRRRDEIIKILEKATGNRILRMHDVNLGIAPFGNMVDMKFSQPSMWLTGALVVSSYLRHSKLLIGYVMGDQINSELAPIQEAWRNLQYFSKEHGAIPIDFPLRLTSKMEILHSINPEALRHVWYCEAPLEQKTKPRPCGECQACLIMSSQFFMWKKKYKKPYHLDLLGRLRGWRRNQSKESLVANDVDLSFSNTDQLVEVAPQ